MIKITRTRLAASVAAATLASAGFGLASVTALASSTGCTQATGALSGSCGDLVNNSNLGWASQSVHAQYNTQVVGAAASDTSGKTDFYAHQTNANDNERVFEYAPSGHLSGLCITDPGRNGLVLRPCSNKSSQQQFYAFGDTQNDDTNSNHGTEWMNVASGQVVTPAGGKGSPLITIPVAAAAGLTSSYFHWAG